MNNVELEPCPLCGNEAYGSREYRENNGADDIKFGCTNPKCLLHKLVDDFCTVDTAKRSFNAIVKKWNTRTTRPAEASVTDEDLALANHLWNDRYPGLLEASDDEFDKLGLAYVADKLSRHRQATQPAHEARVKAWPNFEAPPMYENPAKGWEDTALPDFTKIWEAAKTVGYSVGLHGSMKRDCDLIAIPWIDTPGTPKDLIEALCNALDAKQVGDVEEKPCGRIAVSLQQEGWYKPIDLSIMPAALKGRDNFQREAVEEFEFEVENSGKQHNDLSRRAVKWLLNMGCSIAVDEITTIATSERCDAIGFNSGGFAVVVEVKCSRSDFQRDVYKHHRQPGKGMGSYRYFMAPAGLLKPEELPEGWGLIEVVGKVCRIVKGNKPTYRWEEPYPFETNVKAEKGLLTSLVRRLRDGEVSAQRIGTKRNAPAALQGSGNGQGEVKDLYAPLAELGAFLGVESGWYNKAVPPNTPLGRARIALGVGSHLISKTTKELHAEQDAALAQPTKDGESKGGVER